MSGETTWKMVPDREADRIRIGDRVRVASTHRFYEDWKDVDLEVVGIARTRLGDLNYTLSEDWPRDGGFDDWRERDLVVVSAPKPPAGLYEVRDDGTARRVEVDVVGALRAAERALLSPAPMEDQVIARLGTGQSAIEQVRAALAHLTGNNR